MSHVERHRAIMAGRRTGGYRRPGARSQEAGVWAKGTGWKCPGRQRRQIVGGVGEDVTIPTPGRPECAGERVFADDYLPEVVSDIFWSSRLLCFAHFCTDLPCTG